MLRFENISSSYFFLIIPVILITYWLLVMWRNKTKQSLGDERLITQLTKDKAVNKPKIKLILRLLAIACLVVALINPQIGSKMEKVQRQGANVMIALDVSKSMLAEDITPNRLDKAKMIISKLVDQLAGDRVGLIIYAGGAYVQVPLTSDYSAIKMFLSSINTNAISSQGTAISEVFKLSKTAFQTDSEASQCIIVLSDGEDHESGVDAALAQLKEYGVIIHAVGLGTAQGGPIPMGGKQNFKKDHEGNVVITKLDEEKLQSIALQTAGSYIDGHSVTQSVDHLLAQIKQFDKTDLDSKIITDYESQYLWFAIAAFVLLILEFLLANKKSNWWRKLNLFGTYEH